MNITVRPADAGDVDVVRTLVREFMAESPYLSKLRFDETRFLEDFFTALTKESQVIFLGFHHDEVAGMLWFAQARFTAMNIHFAYDQFAYIRPAHRARKVLDFLMHRGEEWAVQNGNRCIRLVPFCGTNNLGVEKYLLRRGYKNAGNNMILDL